MLRVGVKAEVAASVTIYDRGVNSEKSCLG
jgi:hypothetical protein